MKFRQIERNLFMQNYMEENLHFSKHDYHYYLFIYYHLLFIIIIYSSRARLTVRNTLALTLVIIGPVSLKHFLSNSYAHC